MQSRKPPLGGGESVSIDPTHKDLSRTSFSNKGAVCFKVSIQQEDTGGHSDLLQDVIGKSEGGCEAREETEENEA
jgi:hypothetical protein